MFGINSRLAFLRQHKDTAAFAVCFQDHDSGIKRADGIQVSSIRHKLARKSVTTKSASIIPPRAAVLFL